MVGSGFCECGCGQRTSIAKHSNRFNGNVGGMPKRFIRGHSSRARTVRHGHARAHKPTAVWISWSAMIQRCTNPKNASWKRYGGRGITVCDQWLLFENFLADMGERPNGKTLDRYPNVNGNYELGNCRWATAKEQGQNRAPPSIEKFCARCGKMFMAKLERGVHCSTNCHQNDRRARLRAFQFISPETPAAPKTAVSVN